MAIKSYWDHEPQDRAKMDDETLTLMIDVEAMIKGVTKPTPPKRLPTPASVELKRDVFYRVQHERHSELPIAFRTEEDVRVFLSLNPMIVCDDWETRTKYVEPLKNGAAVVTPFADEQSITERKEELKRSVKDRETIEAAARNYSTKLQKWEKIRDAIVSDHYEQQEKYSEMGAIVMTYKDYVRLAKGDKDVALACLHRTFSKEGVLEAATWLGDDELKREPAPLPPPAPTPDVGDTEDIPY